MNGCPYWPFNDLAPFFASFPSYPLLLAQLFLLPFHHGFPSSSSSLFPFLLFTLFILPLLSFYSSSSFLLTLFSSSSSCHSSSSFFLFTFPLFSFRFIPISSSLPFLILFTSCYFFSSPLIFLPPLPSFSFFLCFCFFFPLLFLPLLASHHPSSAPIPPIAKMTLWPTSELLYLLG